MAEGNKYKSFPVSQSSQSLLRFLAERHHKLFVFVPMVAVDQQNDDDQDHDQSSG